MDVEAPGNDDDLTDEEGQMGSELPSLSPHDQTRTENETGAIPFELHPNYQGKTWILIKIGIKYSCPD